MWPFVRLLSGISILKISLYDSSEARVEREEMIYIVVFFVPNISIFVYMSVFVFVFDYTFFEGRSYGSFLLYSKHLAHCTAL